MLLRLDLGDSTAALNLLWIFLGFIIGVIVFKKSLRGV